MTILFGLDIATILNDSITAAGGLLSGTLTRSTPGTRTPGDLSGGTNPTTTDHTFNGIVERRATRRAGELTEVVRPVVTILGASITIAPDVNDVVVIDGETLNLVELMSRDPASAVYEFIAEA